MSETIDFSTHPLHPGDGVPLFISAGVLKTPSDLYPFLRAEDPRVVPTLGIGALTLPRNGGNAETYGGEDFVYRDESGEAGNCRGLPNVGKDEAKKLKPVIKELTDMGIRTVVQVTNLPAERPADVIPELVEFVAEELQPTAIEANLSCPNGRKANGSFEAPTSDNPEAAAETMGRSRERVGDSIILGAKDSPHVSSPFETVRRHDVEQLIHAIQRYINFLTGINTIGNQEFPELTAGNGRGGMSGPIVAPVAKQWLQIAREALDAHIPILSCGGVDSRNVASELAERQELGAMLVGGAQEFYRRSSPERVSADWVQRVV